MVLCYLLGEVVCSRNYCRQVHQAKTHASDDTGIRVSKIYTLFRKPVSNHNMCQCLSKTAKNKTTGWEEGSRNANFTCAPSASMLNEAAHIHVLVLRIDKDLDYCQWYLETSLEARGVVKAYVATMALPTPDTFTSIPSFRFSPCCVLHPSPPPVDRERPQMCRMLL